jgi:hypothetical protein
MIRLATARPKPEAPPLMMALTSCNFTSQLLLQ